MGPWKICVECLVAYFFLLFQSFPSHEGIKKGPHIPPRGEELSLYAWAVANRAKMKNLLHLIVYSAPHTLVNSLGKKRAN